MTQEPAQGATSARRSSSSTESESCTSRLFTSVSGGGSCTTRERCDEAGIHVVRISDELVDALAQIRDEDVVGIASAWRGRAKQLRGQSVAAIAATLDEMRRFTRDAKRLGKMVVNLFEV